MAKPMFDADALIAMFEGASARQGQQLRQATSQVTLAALQGRELTLKNIRTTLKAVAEAASAGAARNAMAVGGGVDVSALLDQAVAGMDDALLKAVEANRTALGALVSQGADLRDKHLGKALADLEQMEDAMFTAVRKAAAGAASPLAGAWGSVLEKMQAGGTQTGAQAANAAEQLTMQMRDAVRSTRAASIRAAEALAQSYSAVVSGVLIGMSEALQTAGSAGSAARAGGASAKSADAAAKSTSKPAVKSTKG